MVSKSHDKPRINETNTEWRRLWRRWEDGVRDDGVVLLGTRACKTKAKGRESWRQRIEEAKARLSCNTIAAASQYVCMYVCTMHVRVYVRTYVCIYLYICMYMHTQWSTWTLQWVTLNHVHSMCNITYFKSLQKRPKIGYVRISLNILCIVWERIEDGRSICKLTHRYLICHLSTENCLMRKCCNSDKVLVTKKYNKSEKKTPTWKSVLQQMPRIFLMHVSEHNWLLHLWPYVALQAEFFYLPEIEASIKYTLANTRKVISSMFISIQ
jgi:hypothetical protein